MKRLSIIVPIFNVEPYIERCIRSLEDQDILKKDYEIICINDGSPDNSREVVIMLQKEYDNIILIDQENQGVSVARNNGIDIAQGSYLLMVDPDDYIKSAGFKQKLDILEDTDIDVGITGFIILDETMHEEYRYDPEDGPVVALSGIEYSEICEKGKYEIRDPHRSWAIFFNTNFLNSYNLRYLAGVPYLEDGEFIARVMCLAKKVCFLNDLFYMRTTRHESATHSNLYFSQKARNGFLRAAKNLLLFKNHQSVEEQRVFMNQFIIHFTILILTSLEPLNYFKTYSQLVNVLKKGPLKTLKFEGCCDFHKRMARNYNHSLNCFYLGWHFFKFRKSMKLKFKKIFSL